MPIRLKLVLGRFIVAIIGVFSLAVMTSARTSSAADRPTQKINVAYSSISGNVSPLWVTQDKGFFRKYGLEVQSILIESGTTTAQALVAGDISFASVAGPAAIQSNLRGADVVMIAGLLTRSLSSSIPNAGSPGRISSKENPSALLVMVRRPTSRCAMLWISTGSTRTRKSPSCSSATSRLS
jgi:ABC-type nitrate/sulfonate/bicarbonate transport system substrate-binding protein